MADMTITVYGNPAPQGSKSFKGIKGGKGIMVESSKAVKPWREAVTWAALDARSKQQKCSLPDKMVGPIFLYVVFTLHRPKSAKRGAVPSVRPDLSKLIRSTEDALTAARVWEDDARVVECRALKVYPGEHTDALDVPGAVIRISAI